MLNHFAPEDDVQTDIIYHTEIRSTLDQINTEDDKAFTINEIKSALKQFDPKKTPGEDGLTSDILIRVFNKFPQSFTELYNACLKQGQFPTQWKQSIILPIVKPGKEDIPDVTKYRPISLLNVGGKLLERLMINRIQHHLFSNNMLNPNQFGFIPQKNTIDAALSVKEFITNSLTAKKSVVVTSLDVKGAFDAAWWPSILFNLKNLNCPRNLYNLVRDYFHNRSATLSFNSCVAMKKVTKGCPQGSCCGPGVWNVLYNSL